MTLAIYGAAYESQNHDQQRFTISALQKQLIGMSCIHNAAQPIMRPSVALNPRYRRQIYHPVENATLSLFSAFHATATDTPYVAIKSKIKQ